MSSDTGSATQKRSASPSNSPGTPHSGTDPSVPSSNSQLPDVPDTARGDASSSVRRAGNRAPIIYTTDPFTGVRRRRQMMDDLYDRVRAEEPEKWERYCEWRKRAYQKLHDPDLSDSESTNEAGNDPGCDRGRDIDTDSKEGPNTK